jgi:hypothetical protein
VSDAGVIRRIVEDTVDNEAFGRVEVPREHRTGR